MRRTTATLALVLCLLGCGAPAGEPVQLVTVDAGRGCGLLPIFADLIADPTFGTALTRVGVAPQPPPSMVSDERGPAKWPTGFTGRRIGSEVEVLDRHQNVVATTGRRYQIYRVYASRGFLDVICDLVPCTPRCPQGNPDTGERSVPGRLTGRLEG
jgi:hypothetical protein